MRNIKLIIEYDGTNYHGWQSQINAVAIQDVVKAAIKRLTGEAVDLTGSSRTDAGVHAYGQTANFFTESAIPADKFSRALNSILPEDIVIRESCEAGRDFHSRYAAKGKRYRYIVYNSPVPSALMRNRAFYVPQKLNMELMEKAAEHFIGKHDFSAFRASDSSIATAIRTVTEACLIKREETIEFNIEGDGFLYNMVRIISGTLVEVGMGRVLHSDIPGIIESGDRRRAGRTAPPQGLYLMKVFY